MCGICLAQNAFASLILTAQLRTAYKERKRDEYTRWKEICFHESARIIILSVQNFKSLRALSSDLIIFALDASILPDRFKQRKSKMMNPPRHACRGRPMVCSGPCNPLKAHHHHRRHRHHRQRADETSAATSGEDIALPEEFDPILLLKSLKPDTFAASMNDKSISTVSSFTGITLIKISSVPKASPGGTTDDAIPRKIPSREELKRFKEPSTKTSESKMTKPKIEPTIAPETMLHPKEAIVRAPTYLTPRTNEAECIIMERLNRLTAIRASPFFLSLTIFAIYAGIHVLLAIITWRTPAYQFFASSQICGALAFLMWQITGTILI